MPKPPQPVLFATAYPRLKPEQIKKLLAHKKASALQAYANLTLANLRGHASDMNVLWFCVRDYVKEAGFLIPEIEAAYEVLLGRVARPE